LNPAPPIDRIVCLINFDQMIPQKKVLASLERLAKYVMPEFPDDRTRDHPQVTTSGPSETVPMPT
jgi:hypothetical protein